MEIQIKITVPPKAIVRWSVLIASATLCLLTFGMLARADYVPQQYATGQTLSADTLNTEFGNIRNALDEVIPVGTVLPYAGPNVPEGWALCNGDAVSRTDPKYAALWGIINTLYGEGDGATTFNVPDLRGRAPIGVGTGIVSSTGSPLSSRVLGHQIGEEDHAMTLQEMPTHSHNVVDPGHSHSYNFPSGSGASAASGSGLNLNATSLESGSKLTGITLQNNGGGERFNVMQPSLVVNYIVKL